MTVIETKIGENETSGELFDRLSILGGELIIKTLEMLENGEIKPVKQDESRLRIHQRLISRFAR